MNQMSRKLQAGFTLIELIIVITIIAILSAIALPKYIAASTDARVAKIQAMFGSIRTAAALAKARCELDLAQGLTAANTCGNATPRVNMDGTNVDMTFRYPSATAAGIQEAASINAANDGLVVTIPAAGTITFDPNGATTPANCRITYVEAASAAAAPTITLPSTAGC